LHNAFQRWDGYNPRRTNGVFEVFGETAQEMIAVSLEGAPARSAPIHFHNGKSFKSNIRFTKDSVESLKWGHRYGMKL